ncbi:MAG: RNA-binding protein [Chloroflexaceae bacterium]|nr:RNA-binding protein [Chloroflexaceae bacterium]NJL35257.1 RNA-binding protein [Chloroflexaceae bacterium]
MQVNLFVGNLSWNTTEADLEDLFADQGTVQSVRIITDRDTGRSRGFGFVELETSNVDAAIEATNGIEVDGRPLRVNRAEEKEQRPRGPRRDFRGGGGDRGDRGGSRNRY